MKNLGFIIKGYPRLSETFIAQEINLLEKLGYKIHIFSMTNPYEKLHQPILEQIQAEIHYLPNLFEELLTYCSSCLYCFNKFPFRFLYSFFDSLADSLRSRPNKPLKRFVQACWITQTLGQKYPDIKHLHCHFAHDPSELGLRTHQLSLIDFSISAHAKDIYTFPKQQLSKRILASKFVTTCTKANYTYLKSLTHSPEKLHCVYHGINLNLFKPSVDKPTHPLPIILSVARLVPKKGYHVILHALSILKKQGINFEYHVLGDGILRKELEKLCGDLGLGNQVFFHGRVTQEKVLIFMQKSNLFVSGSIILKNGDRDGIPNTIAEAMATQLPIVATKQSGIQELVVHQQSGFLCEPNSPESLAKGISYVLDNPDIARKLSIEGRSRVEEVFDSLKWIQYCSQLFTSTPINLKRYE